MSKFGIGLLVGLILGLIPSEDVFPDGFSSAVGGWGEHLRGQIPGR
jgi:hypothetical protein